jgi:hypothetical protein
MKQVSVTVFAGGREYYFWLDSGLQMVTENQSGDALLNFGGIFASVPVAVGAMAHRPPVITTGAVLAGSDAHAQVSATPLEGNMPLVAAAGPAGGVSGTGLPIPLTPRTDLFGLGLDYQMYHKRFWDDLERSDLSPWQPLGGTFTSAPAAIAWTSDRIDIFGIGLDHAMYTKTCVGEQWTNDWLSLGGSFTSAAALVTRGKLLDIFARGADFTLRGNQTNGTNWFGWQNHGGNLASPPVAVSWGPNRIDIFAVFKDGALWHRWWDGQIWNEWETLGGNYVGEPAVASWAPGRLDVFVIDAQTRELRHYWFSNDTWSNPETLKVEHGQQSMMESPTVVSTAQNRLDVYFLTADSNINLLKWDGQAWSNQNGLAQFRSPQRYHISVDHVQAIDTRALHSDTDAAMISVAAGNAAALIKTQRIGDLGGFGNSDGFYTDGLQIDAVTVDLAEPMSFSYMVVNNGSAGGDKVLAALAKGGDSLSLAGSSSMSQDIAKGVVKIISVKIQELTAEIPVVGPILSFIEPWLMSKLTDIAFANCDGIVAVELRAMIGRDLHILTNNGRNAVTITTTHPGTDSNRGCGSNSKYEVTWTIKPI